MHKRWGLYLSVAFVAIFAMGQGSLSLNDTGIEFPDGSIQTSAALGLGATAQTGFNARCWGTMLSPNSNSLCTAYTVPSGKILVLESVSLRFGKLPDQDMKAMLRVYSGGVLQDPLHWISYEQVGVDGSYAIYETTKLMRMYFEAGESVVFQLLRILTAGNVGYDFAFSGYLVDAAP